MFLKRMKYHTKLACLYSTVMIIIAVSLNYWSYLRESENIKNNSIQTITLSVDQVSNKINNTVDLLLRMSSTLAYNRNIFESTYTPNAKDSRTSVEDGLIKKGLAETMISSQFTTIEEITSIYIYSLDNEVFYQTKKYNYNAVDFREQAWYRKIEASQQQYIIFMSMEKNNKGKTVPVLSIVRKIVNIDNGKLRGYLKIDYDFTHMQEQTLTKLFEDKDSSYMLTDNSCGILLSNIENYSAKRFEDTDLIRKECEGINIQKNNVKYVMAYAKIPKPDWVLVYYVPYTKVLNELAGRYAFQIMVFLVSIAIAIASSFFISIGMTQNIKKLKNAMIIAENNPDIKININTQDEIGMLCKSFNKMLEGIRSLYEKVYKSELEAKEAQIMALQAQINPHFFYNTMETIDSLCMEEDSQAASELVRAMSNNFRYAMKNSKLSTLKEELFHVSDYIKILKVRYPEKFELSILIAEELNDIQIPRLTLQPLVENSILHGVLPKRGFGEITISLKAMEDNDITLEVRDNGIGLTPELQTEINNNLFNIEQPTGAISYMALRNVNNRLKYFYGNDYGLYINSVYGEWTEVYVKLPLKRE